jgi:N6-L-threonylcarbamoyladenine synthase
MGLGGGRQGNAATVAKLKEGEVEPFRLRPAVEADLPFVLELDAHAARARIAVFYPELEFCTDNGAMIALAGALRLQAGVSSKPAGAFAVRPRWPLTGA